MLQKLPDIFVALVLWALAGYYIWAGRRLQRPGGPRLPGWAKRRDLARAQWLLDDLGRRLSEEWFDTPEGRKHVGRELLIGGLVMAVLGLAWLVAEEWPLISLSG